MKPVKIKVESSNLKIQWDNGSGSEIKLKNLRNYCPCAFCASQKEKKGDKFIPIYSGDELIIDQIAPVGKYALNIIWKDGHTTGIYEFDYLNRISEIK